MAIVIGLQIMWGLYRDNEKPILPLGYYYIEGRREWLLAQAPNGRRYYVSAEGHGVLYRQGVFEVAGRYGRYYCDDRETIKLPQQQLTL